MQRQYHGYRHESLFTAATHPVSPQEIVNRLRPYIRKALKLWLYGTPSGQNTDISQVKFKQLFGPVEN
jgi:hypothetical protein